MTDLISRLDLVRERLCIARAKARWLQAEHTRIVAETRAAVERWRARHVPPTKPPHIP